MRLCEARDTRESLTTEKSVFEAKFETVAKSPEPPTGKSADSPDFRGHTTMSRKSATHSTQTRPDTHDFEKDTEMELLKLHSRLLDDRTVKTKPAPKADQVWIEAGSVSRTTILPPLLMSRILQVPALIQSR
jgi:hypothetical protein